MVVAHSRPAPLTWVIAVAELVAAFVVARLILHSSDAAPMPAMAHHHDMGAMTMPMTMPAAAVSWQPLDIAALAAAGAAALWWLLRRSAVAAGVAAAALLAVSVSAPVRTLATGSHLIAMVALEVLMVLVPLLVVSVLPRPRGGLPWTALAIGAAVLYAGLLIGIHLPAVHNSGITAAPVWLPLVAALVGIGYWYGVLRTDTVVAPRTRRMVLVGAQEVAAFIGLLSLFGAWGTMDHDSPIGLPGAWDQRLGGLFMIATCAAVAIPIARRIRQQ
jgi:hypothetical protein